MKDACVAVCTTVDVCPTRGLPDGTQQEPAGCTSDSMMPTTSELETGKTFSCMCGGLPGDASTDWACKQQPLTYWVFTMLPQNHTNTSFTTDSPSASTHSASEPASSSDSFARFLTSANFAASEKTKVDFHVVERGGIMSMDLDPHAFQYAYAGIWEGNFTGCTFATGACTRPMEGNDCFVATCEGAGVNCPPPCESVSHFCQAECIATRYRHRHLNILLPLASFSPLPTSHSLCSLGSSSCNLAYQGPFKLITAEQCYHKCIIKQPSPL